VKNVRANELATSSDASHADLDARQRIAAIVDDRNIEGRAPSAG
jgi:hypothetical protein